MDWSSLAWGPPALNPLGNAVGPALQMLGIGAPFAAPGTLGMAGGVAPRVNFADRDLTTNGLIGALNGIRGDWNKFEARARPSENIEDQRVPSAFQRATHGKQDYWDTIQANQMAVSQQIEDALRQLVQSVPLPRPRPAKPLP